MPEKIRIYATGGGELHVTKMDRRGDALGHEMTDKEAVAGWRKDSISKNHNLVKLRARKPDKKVGNYWYAYHPYERVSKDQVRSLISGKTYRYEGKPGSNIRVYGELRGEEEELQGLSGRMGTLQWWLENEKELEKLKKKKGRHYKAKGLKKSQAPKKPPKKSIVKRFRETEKKKKPQTPAQVKKRVGTMLKDLKKDVLKEVDHLLLSGGIDFSQFSNKEGENPFVLPKAVFVVALKNVSDLWDDPGNKTVQDLIKRLSKV